MKKTPSVLIASLSLTALVMGIIFLATPPRPAAASMMADESSLLMITSGQVSGTDESLIILDKGTGKMLVYRLNNNAFELVGNSDLNAIFEHSGAASR